MMYVVVIIVGRVAQRKLGWSSRFTLHWQPHKFRELDSTLSRSTWITDQSTATWLREHLETEDQQALRLMHTLKAEGGLSEDEAFEIAAAAILAPADDTFLGKLPKGWPYAIEMRNKHWLRDEYFGCLTQHAVTHVYNSWDAP